MIFNFYVSFSGKSGYGHLFRSMALEIELRKRGHECYWKKSLICGNGPDWWIIDTPDLSFSSKGDSVTLADETKICYLGATGNLSYDRLSLDQCDLVVCQGAGIKRDEKWLVGFEYALLWPGLHVVDGQENQENKVFVYRSIYKDMEDIARTLNDHGVPVHLATGSSIRNDKQFDTSAVVIITPWGMTSLEAMYLGIPQVAICFQRHAMHSAMEASKAGAIHLLFSNEHAWKERAINEALLLLDEYGDPDEPSSEHYLSMQTAGQKLIDGQGAMRVADALEARS